MKTHLSKEVALQKLYTMKYRARNKKPAYQQQTDAAISHFSVVEDCLREASKSNKNVSDALCEINYTLIHILRSK
jgi:hypothetical protein